MKYKAVSKNGTKVLLNHIKKCTRKPLEPSQSRLVFTEKDKEKQKGWLGFSSPHRGYKRACNDEDDKIHKFQFNQELSQQAPGSC